MIDLPEVIAVPVGLQDICYSKLIKDDSTGVEYGTPKMLAPAITAKVTPSVNSATLFGNDGPVVTANALGEIAVEIGVASLSLTTQADLLGSTIVDGMLIDNADDVAPEVALGYKRTLHDGSIVYVWLLKGKFNLPVDEATTKQGTPTFQTPVIVGTFLKRLYDGNWRFRAHSADPDAAGRIATWFTSVPDETGIPNP